MTEHPGPHWSQRLLVLPLVLVIRAYQWLVSRRLPPVCVFEPSCSEYTRLALLRHGLVRGLSLGLARTRRCDGGTFRGIDPPPGYPNHRWSVPDDRVPHRISAQLPSTPRPPEPP